MLLTVAGLPIGFSYLWYGILAPSVSSAPNDFRQVYLEGARIIAAGGDPYQCSTSFCSGHTTGWLGVTGAVYPPFALWLIQPFTRIDASIASAIALLAVNACLGGFVVLAIRALQIDDWQERALIAMLCVSFAPTLVEVQNGNFQLLVLLISGVLLTGWLRGDRWWGGLALGVGLAIKLVESPVLLLAAWGRRWRIVATSVVTLTALWLIGAPGLLPEYLFHVLPSVSQGAGDEMNIAPLGAVARLFYPQSLYLQGRGVDIRVLAVTAAIGLAVLLLTAWCLRRPRTDSDGRSIELAAAFAATPLLLTLVWDGQLILLLLPMIVLIHRGLRHRSRGMLIAVATSWMLIGPVYLAFTNAFAIGRGFPVLFEIWVDSPLVGMVILWLAALSALRSTPARGS